MKAWLRAQARPFFTVWQSKRNATVSELWSCCVTQTGRFTSFTSSNLLGDITAISPVFLTSSMALPEICFSTSCSVGIREFLQCTPLAKAYFKCMLIVISDYVSLAWKG